MRVAMILVDKCLIFSRESNADKATPADYSEKINTTQKTRH